MAGWGSFRAYESPRLPATGRVRKEPGWPVGCTGASVAAGTVRSVPEQTVEAPRSLEPILAGLNTAQREAAVTVTGPVAILAGAGTGKTTTITRRIACQVASGAFAAEQILAVTFTDKAAGELKARLQRLGVPGVEARTFHSAAMAQLSRLWERHTGQPLAQILNAKAPLLSTLANALPLPHRFVPRRELATEIEWAKVRMVPPDRYLSSLADHQPPIPPELMLRVYQGYERRKQAMRRLDFEDMLGLSVRLFDDHPAALADVRARYAAFTVDEFQDVSPLQVELLDRWLGHRDQVCVVGDDYQTIYTFAGATPRYLLEFAGRFPAARVLRLETNYRSTPQVLETANRLVPRLGGFSKTLQATKGRGPEPVVRACSDEAAEAAFVVDRVRTLHAEGVPLHEMAVLYRINARSERFEEALAAARIPYQVKDGTYLSRPGPRAALQGLRRTGPAGAATVSVAVDRVTAALGFDPDLQADSAEEATRQADLGRLRSLAEEFDASNPSGDLTTFQEELRRRFADQGEGRGVNLLTFHRAKGLEFDAVFLPRLVDGELPFRAGRRTSDVVEERRLLYVGNTRARRHLFVTWPSDARAGRSPFVDELAPSVAAGRGPVASPGRAAASSDAVPDVPDPLFDSLRRWRRERAAEDGKPAYVVFADATLHEIAARRPRTLHELLAVRGVGLDKLTRYGAEVLELVRSA
jgi:DNA helicase-2/ATP-dependent DNA helicase PcrA